MPLGVQKIRVLIPTTREPVEILLLTEEDPTIGRSVACIGGTTETADIAAAYHAFIVRPTGVIERLFGHSCYRLDVSGRIDAGSSWQLGVLAAHALHAAGRLAQEKDTPDATVWATGSVRPVDLTVNAVSHVAEKLSASMERIKAEAASGRRVLVAIPSENEAALSPELKAELSACGAKVLLLGQVQTLWEELSLAAPVATRRPAANPQASMQLASSSQGKRRHAWVAAAAAVLCVGVGLIYLPGWLQISQVDPATPPPPPLRTAELEVLVPETVPFISDRARTTLRTEYLSAPDHKAIAISSSQLGFVTAQRTEDAAKSGAMAACQRANDVVQTRSQCELYAVGNTVVSVRGRPPMPEQPWVIRDLTIETPFESARVPLVSDRTRAALETEYAQRRNARALAISARGYYSSYTTGISSDESARRALERCGSNAGVACMVVALDDKFIVPIPRSMKVIGFARPAMINAILPELREQVARQLGNATTGWKALAIGASGRVGTALGADSEQAAVEQALENCGRQDRECRIVVIGPFLVERGRLQVATTPPPAPPVTSSPLADALASIFPLLNASEREELAHRYEAFRPHRAIAIVPGTNLRWITEDWPSADLAAEGSLERCYIVHGKVCVLAAVDNDVRAPGADGKWPLSDIARVRYAGTFDPARIPAVRPELRLRPDILAYRDATGPKAAALHPRGGVVLVTDAENQRAAEVAVLAQCNAAPFRGERNGPCFLYAVGSEVVLRRRSTGPLTPQ
jgi:hypothetical protein